MAFIPLYPKLPLVNIQNTWVYVRLEDFFVFGVLILWLFLMGKKKVSFTTPLTSSMFLFWMVGGIATVHGVLLIFPTISNVFPNVALFSFIRRIEYMSVFFISYWGIRDKQHIRILLYVLAATVLCISLYGLGQRYLGFPAFLTMNEEFAKGVPLTLSKLSRIPSTFGGHYDLAAYLVLTLPILISMIFGGIQIWLIPIIGLIVALGSYVLVLTVSRISLIGLIVAAMFVIMFYARRLLVYILPFVFLLGVVAISVSPTILSRFASTLTPVDILIDANTGSPIGKVTNVPNLYFKDKVVRQQNFTSPHDYVVRHESMDPKSQIASISGIIIPYTLIPDQSPLMVSSIISTGEDLPQGTGYVNLPLSPITKRLNNFYYEIRSKDATKQVEVQVINGPYLIKKSLAYDLSYTTRFQGEWPHAIQAFKRNIFLGSGYGSVSLAVDNSYLRMLAEVGALGTVSFITILVLFGLYIYKQFDTIESPLVKSMAVGVCAGIVGLAVNAIFIDVFEASKVAFSLWLLIGASLGTMKIPVASKAKDSKNIYRIFGHPLIGILTILLVGYTLYGSITANYFQGDDFTWLRWASSCENPSAIGRCPVQISQIVSHFLRADGFFYRPGTKIYFDIMQGAAWLDPSAYHAVSLFLHILISTLIYLLFRMVFKSGIKALIGALLFVSIAGYSESVVWISAIGLQFTALFTLIGMFLSIRWNNTHSKLVLLLSLLSMFIAMIFHEMGVIAPLIALSYIYVFMYSGPVKTFAKQHRYWIFLSPIIVYLSLRFFAGSHWFNGDYSYDLYKLPYNVVGNTIGYLAAILGGPSMLSIITLLRVQLRAHLAISAFLLCILMYVSYHVFKYILKTYNSDEKRVALFGMLFSIVSLLPFLGLGNIALRYGYMATIGVVMLLVIMIKKMYEYMLINGEDIARYSVILCASIFLLFQLVQRNKVLDNWQESGEKIRRSVISLNAAYTDDWSSLPMEFHIVNLPIKNGYAWMYPVGFPDMVWFVTKNDSVRIFYDSSVATALDSIQYGSKNQKVFEFTDTGALVQKFKEWKPL